MNIEEFRDFCLSLPHVIENQPWKELKYQMLATYSIGGKWFCLVNWDKKFIDVKCAPETIAEMQLRYEGAFPAWHMNKQNWLGIKLESDIPDAQIKKLIAAGRNLIVTRLPNRQKKELGLIG